MAVPNIFVVGTLIDAVKMNENFDYLVTNPAIKDAYTENIYNSQSIYNTLDLYNSRDIYNTRDLYNTGILYQTGKVLGSEDISTTKDIYTTALTSSGLGTTGWVATPSPNYYRYERIGKRVIVYFSISGTSTTGATSITGLPACGTITGGGISQLVYVADNGSSATGMCRITSGSTTLTFYKNVTSATFTTSGQKVVEGSIIYPVN